MPVGPGIGLLERDREIAAIARLFAAAEGGAGAMLRIEGPPGIGKSRLLAAARGAAEHAGLRVLAARGSELETDFGFGIVRQLLEPALARADPVERAALLSGAAALAAPVLEAPGAPQAGDEAGEEATPAALHGVYWLCAGLAEQKPLLLCIDDLHWADEPSLRWLVYLLQRLEGLRIAVVAGVRGGEGRHAAALLEALAAHPLATTLEPAPLSPAAVERLLAERGHAAAAPGFALACHRATGGNPFLVGELLQELAERRVSPGAAAPEDVADLSPAAVRRSVLARLRRLPPACDGLARALAILGEGVELHAAARFAGLDPDAAAAAAGELAAAHILEPGRPLAFVHPVVRAAVRANLAQGDAADAHGQAARLLRDQGASPDRIALHLLNAPPAGDARVVEDLRAAARDALARGAPELAARLLRRALREPPAADVTRDMLLELGAAEMGAAEMERSLEHLQRAVELSADPEARGRATLALAGVLLRMNRGPEAHEALARAVAETDGELRSMLEGARLQSAYASPRAFAAYRASAPAAPPPDGEPRTLGERIACGRQALWESLHGTAGTARELADRAWGRGELVEALGPADPAAGLPVTAQLWADDLESTVARLTFLVDESRRRGSVRGFVVNCHFRAIAWWRRGALLEVEADAGNALEHGAPYGLPLAVPVLAMALLERGQPAAAEAAMARVPVPPAGELPGVAIFMLEARARVDAAQRRVREARAALERAEALEREYDLGACGISQWREVAVPLLAAAGEEARAVAMARAWARTMEAYGAPRPHGIALGTLAAVAPAEERMSRHEAAVAVLRGSGARLDLARALVEHGAALRRDRRRGEARAPLREGQELAVRCGATLLAARAEQELAAAGEQPRHGVEQRDELTAHELRVARMAADGMTNREIAQALFVTQKTIEAHLSSVYRKLDIRSRVQLVRALPDTEAVGA